MSTDAMADDLETAAEKITPATPAEKIEPQAVSPLTIPRPIELGADGKPILNADGTPRRKGGRPRKAVGVTPQAEPASVIGDLAAAGPVTPKGDTPAAAGGQSADQIRAAGKMCGHVVVAMLDRFTTGIGGTGASLTAGEKSMGAEAVADYMVARNVSNIPPEVVIMGVMVQLGAKAFTTDEGRRRGLLMLATAREKLGV